MQRTHLHTQETQKRANLVHVRDSCNIPLANVAVERRPCGTRRVEQIRNARHRCGVPACDRTVRCRRRDRVVRPRRRGRGDVCVGDGRLRSDVRGEEEEQREAGEAVRPHRQRPSAHERHDALQCRRATARYVRVAL